MKLNLKLYLKIIQKTYSKPKRKASKQPKIKYQTININIKEKGEINSLFGGINNLNFQKMNININVQPKRGSLLVEKTDENDPSDNCYSPSKSKSKSKNWRRLSNLFKSINKLSKLEAKNISSDCDIDKEIIEHQEKLYVKKSSMKSPERTIQNLQTTGNQNPAQIPLFQDNTNKEMYRLRLKENCLKLITDGGANTLEKLKELFRKDPDQYLL